MNFIDERIEQYAHAHTQPHSQNAEELHNWTIQNVEQSQMLSGSIQAAILQMLIRTSGVTRVLEIGMYTGYSALAMAEALPKEGELITLDIEPEREKIARAFFDKSEHGRKVSIVIAPALDSLRVLSGSFGLVYIDADKANYINYYEAVLPLLPSGGIIVADNVLWSSKVLDPQDESSQSLHEYNEHVHNDPRVTNILLTIRDGLMVAVKN